MWEFKLYCIEGKLRFDTHGNRIQSAEVKISYY